MDKSRRKSSFFRRQQLYSVCDSDSSPKCSPRVREEEEKIIWNYIDKMEKEIKDWQNKRREVKSEFQKLDHFKDDVHVVTWNDCVNDLTKEDVEFLNARPDCRRIVKKLENLTEKVEIIKHKTYDSKLKLSDNVNAQLHKLNDFKQNICEYLLSTDESENLYANDDSGINCSMESFGN